MKKDTTNDMTVGSPVSLIIKFMIPMCLGNLFQQFYNIADSIVAGNFIGVNALAAIGSTGSLMFFVTGWLNACRNVVSFCDVSFIAFFRIVCFCLKSSVFVGSSFKSLLTSLSSSCVIFMALFVPFNALCSFVVSPPISIVIPAILLFALMNHLPQKTAPDLHQKRSKSS